jgi:hypothetical protein
MIRRRGRRRGNTGACGRRGRPWQRCRRPDMPSGETDGDAVLARTRLRRIQTSSDWTRGSVGLLLFCLLIKISIPRIKHFYLFSCLSSKFEGFFAPQILSNYHPMAIDGACGSYKNKHFIHAAYYCSVADTILWLYTQPIMINRPWLNNSLPQTFTAMIQPWINSLHQSWNLPGATTSPPQILHNKADLSLGIPSPQYIQHWPQHSFPTQGDFGRHIKAQLKSKFLNHLPKA